MIANRSEFIKSFLPDEVENIELTQINLDITDLGLGDILRNLNKIYPANTRTRNAIISGRTVVGVLCKTATLSPLSGLFILVASDKLKFELMSTSYLIVCLAESVLRNEDEMNNAIYNLTDYLVDNYRDTIKNLPDFYRKFIYDPSDMEDDDDYVPEED